MKCFLFLFSFLYVTAGIHAQLMNGGFEDWIFSDGFEKPVYWETTNHDTYVAVTKVSPGLVGDYALRVSSKGEPNFDQPTPGIARIEFTANQNYNTLHSLIQIDSFHNTEATIRVMKKVGKMYETINWKGIVKKTNGPEWFSIPAFIEKNDTILLTYSVINYYAYPDFHHSMIIDDVSLDYVSNTHAKEYKTALQIFPNPTSEVIHIQSKEDFVPGNFIRILNMGGELLFYERQENSDMTIGVQDWKSGIYLVQFLSGNGKLLSIQKFVIQ